MSRISKCISRVERLLLLGLRDRLLAKMSRFLTDENFNKTQTMLSVNIPPKFKVTPEQFDLLASYEQENRMELTAMGKLIVMPPTGGTAGKKNSKLTYQLEKWSEINGTGEVFDSSTMFILPNG